MTASYVLPNINALKQLAIFGVDAQFVHQIGSQYFNFAGDESEAHLAKGERLVALIDDAAEKLEAIRSNLPMDKTS